MLSFRASRRVRAPGTPVFFIRSRPLFIRLPVLAPRGMQEFFISRHLCIAWSVGVTVINDVMSLTRYTARVPENHVTIENGRGQMIDNQRKDR